MDFLVTQRYSVSGMHCAACAHSVESLIRSQSGVTSAEVHFATATASVEFNTAETNTEHFHQVLQPFGFDVLPAKREWEHERLQRERAYRAQLQKRTIVAWICAVPIMILSMRMQGSELVNSVQLLLCLVSLVYAGHDFFVHAYQSARIATTSMDTLIALSTGLAFLWSVVVMFAHDWLMQQGVHAHLSFESAAMVIAFVLLGKMLEERAKDQSHSAVDALQALQPERATVVRDGRHVDLSIDELRSGDRVLVSAGEAVAVDGVVVTGQSACDESMLSGESLAVPKNPGSKVFAGTINQQSVLQIEARSVGDETMLAHIRDTVRNAQETKVAAQRMVDFVSARFVPSVIAIALVTFIVWLWVGGSAHLGQALSSALAVLVVACPCALGLAAPIAVVIGIGRAAHLGILVRNAETLEHSCTVQDILFDKTGTLTQSELQADKIIWYRKAVDQAQVLSVVYAAELQSQHPRAQAIQTALKKKATAVQLDDCKEVPSKGMIAHFAGSRFIIGSAAFVKSMLEHSEMPQVNAVFVADDQGLVCALPFVEAIAPTAQAMLQSLRSDGYTVHLVSGDQHAIVEDIAKKCGIDEWQAECTPEIKERYVRELQAKGRRVAMVGDGINDAPSLARADLSIAMGGGTDTAMQASDVVLMRSRLELLPMIMHLSRRTRQLIRQNLAWAFLYNLLLIPLAAGALQPFFGWQLDPMYAGAAMALSSISVVTNSLRLKTLSLD